MQPMIPAWLEAVILGIVQGLTEFIPVSSSGHLVLVPYLMGWEKHSLAFDVMLHVGTLGAVLVYFRGELSAIVRGLLRLDRSPMGEVYRRVGLLLIPASVPVAVVGLALAGPIEDAFGSPLVASLLLLVTATLLLTAEAIRSRRVRASGLVVDELAPVPANPGASGSTQRAWTGSWREGKGQVLDLTEAPVGLPLGEDASDPTGTDLSGITLRHAMTAGFAQCLAVLPGISRAGSTITGGVFAGLTREAATRFSFLLAIPALVGATILSLPDLADGGEALAELAGGMLAAFVSGYLAIRFLVRLVSRERLTGFAYYCLAASAVGVIGWLMLGPPSTV